MTKLLAFTRWAIFEIFIGLYVAFSYIFYPISYLFKDFIRKSRYGSNKILKIITFPLWIYLDDSAKYDWGDDWWINVNKTKLDTKWQRFVASYKWSVLRNPAWNIYTFIKPKNGVMVIISETGELTRNGIILKEDTDIWNDFAVMKFVDENGVYTDNKGIYLSMEYSIIGESFVWYKIGETLYWRYSKVKKISNKKLIFLYNLISSIFSLSNRFDDKDWWIETQLGTNENRYTVRNKIKKINGIYEEL